MAVSSVNSYNSTMRIGGLATGFDTDQMVKDLMTVERIPLDKLSQKKQMAEWKRDEYQSITNLLRGLKDDYFNVLKPGSNMLSSSSYKKFTGTSSDSSVITVAGNADSLGGSHTIIVKNIATVAANLSASSITMEVAGTELPSLEAAKGKSFTFVIDGIGKVIDINSDSTNNTEMIADIQNSIDMAFGENKVVVADSVGDGTGYLKFLPQSSSGITRISVYSGPSETTDALGALGFTSNSNLSNRINVTDSLENVSKKLKTPFAFDLNGQLNLTINGQNFKFDKTSSLNSMMNEISRNTSANATMQYDEVNDIIKFAAKKTGAGNNLQIGENASTFLTAVNFTLDAGYYRGAYTSGADAKVIIDEQELTRSSNAFTLSGTNYTLIKASPLKTGGTPGEQESQTVSLVADVDGVLNNIKSFVEKYNDIISKMNLKLSEKYDRNYQPLTTEQKDGMSEEDVKKWEDKAKTGLLRNDSLVQNITYGMRRALSDSVNDTSINLADIGITTGSYDGKGKLIIDEDKLKAAIQGDSDAVMSLFSKQSSVTSNISLNAEQRSTRYNEEGLAYRIFDVIENNIRTTRDSDSMKGLLLEKAGIDGDVSEFKNMIYNEINDYEDRMKELSDKLISKEDRYYTRFAAMEKMIAQMNSQSNWISSQFGQTQG